MGIFFQKRNYNSQNQITVQSISSLIHWGSFDCLFVCFNIRNKGCCMCILSKKLVFCNMLIITLLCCFEAEKFVKDVMLHVGLWNSLFCSTFVHQVNTRQICTFKITISYWQKPLCLEHKSVTVALFVLHQYSCPHSSILKQSKMLSHVLSGLQMASHKEWSLDPV